MTRSSIRTTLVFLILVSATAAYSQEEEERTGWAIRFGMSNEGAPVVGGDYAIPLTKYLHLMPSVDASAGEDEPWLGLNAVLRIPIAREYAVSLAGGLASVDGDRRYESGRVLAPATAIYVGGRGYAFFKTIAAEERRFAIGGGFRF